MWNPTRTLRRKNEACFSYILPFVEEENRDILAERERIEKLHRTDFQEGRGSPCRNRKWLNNIGEEYDFASVEKPTEEFLSQLLERVDVRAQKILNPRILYNFLEDWIARFL